MGDHKVPPQGPPPIVWARVQHPPSCRRFSLDVSLEPAPGRLLYLTGNVWKPSQSPPFKCLRFLLGLSKTHPTPTRTTTLPGPGTHMSTSPSSDTTVSTMSNCPTSAGPRLMPYCAYSRYGNGLEAVRRETGFGMKRQWVGQVRLASVRADTSCGGGRRVPAHPPPPPPAPPSSPRPAPPRHRFSRLPLLRLFCLANLLGRQRGSLRDGVSASLPALNMHGSTLAVNVQFFGQESSKLPIMRTRGVVLCAATLATSIAPATITSSSKLRWDMTLCRVIVTSCILKRQWVGPPRRVCEFCYRHVASISRTRPGSVTVGLSQSVKLCIVNS